MTFSTMQARVKDFLDRTDIDTKIENWINDVRDDLATEFNWPHLWTESYLTTTAGSSDYTLPADYLDHSWVQLGSKALNGYNERDWEHQVLDDEDTPPADDEPTGYYIRGERLKLRPTPDAAYTLTLFYYAQPTALSLDADTDFFTIRYPWVIIHGACILGSVWAEDNNRIQIHSGLYDKMFKKMMKKERAKRWTDVNLQIRTYKDFATSQFRDRLTASNT